MSYEKTQKQNAKDVASLEGKYSDRDLRFTSQFEGFAPIQAYGHLDGKRFYFRLRGGDASLRLGEYDLQIEVEQAIQHDRMLRQHKGASLLFGEEPGKKTRVPKESDADLYPTIITHTSGVLAGKLRMVELFSKLVDTLEPVSEESGS